ncbi:hypothetical protein E2C01_014291 [Portunus trituberculatus]|uniref:SGNH hydrolase-type esterase domain-containing protein n=1 Tax=Portunus trituberculatus TaxID=210409 RepID=A0A5B7DIT3_PORTR|nr:hypothetical protein [Portunus trituberculatus]
MDRKRWARGREGSSWLEDGTKPIVFLSTGENDLCEVKSEELFRRFREFFGKIRRRLSDEWLSTGIAVNCSIVDLFKSNGWAFIDNWDLFYGKNTLYGGDGVHLTRQGVRIFVNT